MTDRERYERTMRELRRPLPPFNPWAMLETELAHLLNDKSSPFAESRARFAEYLAARKADWQKRHKLTLSDTERARLAEVLSSGPAGRRYGLGRFLRARG
jgi:hypothetical protein